MAGYTRQSSGTIVDAATITASDHNAEYDQVELAMDATTGHAHDGTVGEGPKISLTAGISGVLPIASGGTAGATASAARTALGLEIGTDVQAHDAGLASIAGLTTAADTMVYTTALDTYATASLTSFGRSLIDDITASVARTTLGLGTIATQASSSVSITGGSITGITDLAIADGGTGSSTASTARTALGVAIGSNVQAWDADLDTYSANPLTAAELGELQNIGVSTVSATQWGYLGATDQGLTTTSNVAFGSVTGSGIVSTTDATASTSATTGSGIFAGGVGIAGTFFVGGNINFAGALPTINGNDGDGYLWLSGGVNSANGANIGLYGVSHASHPNKMVLRHGTTVMLTLDGADDSSTFGGDVISAASLIGSTDFVTLTGSTSIVHDTHANRILNVTAAGATTQTINSTTGTYQEGDIIQFSQYGAGQVTIAAGAGYTMRKRANRDATTDVQYSQVVITFLSSTEFVLSGDLTVV